jgi:phosphoesterase RecJ-like protein
VTLAEAAALLRSWDDIVIHTHRRPDGDTCGSAAALCLGLRSLGKTAYVARNPELTERYLGYVRGCFAPPDFVPRYPIAVDVAAAQQLPDGVPPDSIELLLDHHRARPWARRGFVRAESAACGEVVFDLLEELGVPLTQELALPLYLAVSTDTGCFLYSNTNARTHESAARLIRTGIDIHPVNSEMFERRSRARIAVECAILQNAEFSPGGALAILSVPLSLQRESGAIEDDLDNISSLARTISGVKIGATLREEQPGEWRVSVRTFKPYDASLLCARIGGGGGHLRAGGCRAEGTPDEVRATIRACVFAEYPEVDHV